MTYDSECERLARHFLSDEDLEATSVLDPRDPRPDFEMVGRDPIFRDHNCWRCDSGRKTCPHGYSRQCENLHARND